MTICASVKHTLILFTVFFYALECLSVIFQEWCSEFGLYFAFSINENDQMPVTDEADEKKDGEK